MNPALLALSVCTFALGFAEFVTVSLVPAIAQATHFSVAQIGLLVGMYAIGVSVGAPVLSTLLSRYPRRRVLSLAMWVFALSNLAVAMSGSFPIMIGSRFVGGLMHGLLLALASATAAAAADPNKSGAAIATVFAGLTVALVVGVPLGTLAGESFAWTYVFIGIAAISVMGALGLAKLMPEEVVGATVPANAGVSTTLSDPKILCGVAVTALGYAGSFTGFTYIAVVLKDLTHLTVESVTAMFAVYGVSAAIGNALGGHLVDKAGSRTASMLVIAGIGAALLATTQLAGSVAAMAVILALWDLASFGAVPILQKTVVHAAETNPAASSETASGLNIAGFNIGIAAGSALGGLASQYGVLNAMYAGLVPVALALVLATRLKKAESQSTLTHPELQPQGFSK